MMEDTDVTPIPSDIVSELGDKLVETKDQGHKLIGEYRSRQGDSETEKVIRVNLP